MKVFEPNLSNGEALALAAAFRDYKARCDSGDMQPLADVDADRVMTHLLDDLSQRSGIPRDDLRRAGLHAAMDLYG